jgi:CrcB protein
MKIAYFLVFMGGGIGAIVRLFISTQVDKWRADSPFPLGILLVNISGCVLMGALSGYFVKHGVETAHVRFWLTGFCGGFTTFSSFAMDNVQLFESGIFLPIINIILSVALGCLGAAVGYQMAR